MPYESCDTSWVGVVYFNLRGGLITSLASLEALLSFFVCCFATENCVEGTTSFWVEVELRPGSSVSKLYGIWTRTQTNTSPYADMTQKPLVWVEVGVHEVRRG